MSIELTAAQQKAFDEQQEYPCRVVNPRTRETFVLIPAEMYERVRGLLEDEDELPAVRETYPLVTAVLDSEGTERSSKESA